MQQNGVMVNQRLFRNECMKGFVKKDDELLCFTLKPYIALWKRSLLPPLSDADEVTETRHEKVVSIHPVHPLVDLKKECIPDVLSIYPTIPPCFPIIHTTFIVKDVDHRYPWTKNELAGNAILSCFTNAVATANKLYGVSWLICTELIRNLVMRSGNCSLAPYSRFRVSLTRLPRKKNKRGVSE
ncbi:hypothetical protein D918_07881 [Trichuris suis]|nr:hypothetical protein D918_07881 [Trichuris suis]